MKRYFVCLLVLACMVIGSGLAFAEGPVTTVVEGCKKEIETYCSKVTPGEGRVLACLLAYEDKLSNRCEYALYDAASQLERVVNALTYLASECKDDLKKFCSEVKPGEGRLLQCIDKNKEKITPRCTQAIKDVKKK